MSVYDKGARSWQDSQGDKDLISYMEECAETHFGPNLTFQYQANLDVRFYVGDQRVWREVYGQEMSPSSYNLNFNLLRRYVEWPVGYQRQNRKTIIATPIEGSDQKTADQFTKVLFHINQDDSVDETISTAFLSSAISGISFLRSWLDYSRDPLSGDLRISNVPYNALIFDSYFQKPDASDCSFMWQRSYVDSKQLALLLPSYKDKLDDLGLNLHKRYKGNMAFDGKFQFMPESIFYARAGKGVIYDEFFYKDLRQGIFLYDPKTLKQIEWVGERDKLRDYLSYYNSLPGVELKVLEQEVSTVKQAVVVNGHIIYHGGNTMGIDEYQHVPVLAYYTPESNSLDYRLQGLIRGMRDAQFVYNQTTTDILRVIKSQPNSGWIAKENAVVNPTSLWKTGPGQVIFTTENAQPGDVQKMPPGQMQPGMFEISQEMKKLPQDISGVPEELMGAANDDVSGILAKLRQGAGLILLRRLFDQLDTSMRILGKILIKAIQAKYTPGKIHRILNEDPSPEFRDRDFGTYDVAIEEGFNTSTQRQLAFAQAMQLKEIIPNFPDKFVIKHATIQDKDEILEEMDAQAQQLAQQQKMQSEQQAQEQEATIKMAVAQARYQEAGATERMSRIPENMSMEEERRAKARKDEQEALLSKIKAIKELESIDLSHLEKLISIANSVTEKSKQESELTF
jgi:hypothetical protein